MQYYKKYYNLFNICKIASEILKNNSYSLIFAIDFCNSSLTWIRLLAMDMTIYQTITRKTICHELIKQMYCCKRKTIH